MSVQAETAGATLLEHAGRIVDVLVAGGIPDGPTGMTWPAWELDAESRPVGVVAGRAGFYGGDSGIVHALHLLGPALGRPEAASAAARGRVSLASRAGSVEGPGLLVGGAGVALAAGLPLASPRDPFGRDATGGLDLTDGVAGALVASVVTGGSEPDARQWVAVLRQHARRETLGCSWPDGRLTGDRGRPLLGLAHGASGIVWALVETANRHPALADEALALADGALAWEASWIDPRHGGWPDLRDGVSWPDLWCHGAAGAGAVRLRLLELQEGGLVCPWPEEMIRAEAEMAVQRCGQAVSSAVAAAVASGGADLPAGLTLCHGLGGPLALLSQAARVLGEGAHAEFARDAAREVLALLPEEPDAWPCGLAGADGDYALLNGLAGTALLLTELALPGSLPPTALLGLSPAAAAR